MKKRVFCPKCGGHGFITYFEEYKDSCNAWSERCSECNGNGEIEVFVTNGDKLRSMSDEQIANWFSKLVCHNCATTFECNGCYSDDEDCAKEILKWLKKEVKDGCL